MSFEDGKWAMRDGQLQFLPDYETISRIVTELPGFVKGKVGMRHGSYVSGSAVREDAGHIFKKIEATVCTASWLITTCDGI